MRWVLICIGVVPPGAALKAYFYFSLKDPSRLHSEDYQLRHEALVIVESKGGEIVTSPTSLGDLIPIFGRSVARERDTAMSPSLVQGSDRSLWVYLLAFDQGFGATKEIQEYLTSMQDVDWWYRCLPNAIFVTSYLSAKSLSQELRKRFPNGRHIILDCDTDREGLLPKKAWSFISKPKKRGEE
jgi:hypothetical protein